MTDIIIINQSNDIKLDEFLKKDKISNDKFNKIDEDFNSNQFRILCDTTTKIFNNTFFNDKIIIKKFINFAFNRIDIDLKLHLNKELINNDIPPLNIDESVKFLFKGGNLFNYYFNEVKNKNNNNNFSKISNSFSLSDNDFTLLINADNKLRYELFKKHSTLIIYNSLNKIVDVFNKIFYKNFIRGEKYENNNIDQSENINLESIKEDIKELEYLFGITKQTSYYMFKNKIFYKKLFIDSDLDIWRIYNICANILYMNDWTSNGNLNYITKKNANEVFIIMINILKIKSNLLILKKKNDNLYILGIKVQIYNLLKELDNTFLDNNLLTNNKNKNRNFIGKINKIMYNYTNEIKKSNFYDRTKINNFKINLSNELKSLENNKFYKLDGNFKVLYDYQNKNQITPENIKFKNKNNTLISLNQYNEKIEIYNINTYHNYHYLTSNLTINKTHKYQIIDFDLLRIKLNVRLQNILIKNGKRIEVNIPSEFIDISIPSYEDTTNRSTLSNYNKYITLLNYNDCLIQSFTLEYAIKDIEYVFFSQYFWAPFLADKYEKRVTRYIFFQKYYRSKLNDLDLIEFKTIVDIIKNVYNNLIKSNNQIIIDGNYIGILKNYVYQNINIYDISKIYKDQDLNNILNDRTDIDENNKILLKLLKNILLLAKVYKFNDNDLFNFIEYYNKQYKLEGEITIEKYRDKLIEFIENVRDKYELINGLF